MGAKRENVWVTDIDGVVYEGRENMDQYMAPYAKQTDKREALTDVIEGADVFLGLSAAGNI
jgi:malate dehydrogenase (oxaloacetate-decarboxylating)(NADP+)